MGSPGKCILVTGPPSGDFFFFWYQGIGKTTLVMRVVERLRTALPDLKVQGFYTREIRQGSERVGFEVVTLQGQRGLLASTTTSRQATKAPTVGKYKVDVASFESLALPELQVKEETDLFVIDEVGKMELFSPSFFPAVLQVLESNIPILASIPIPKFGRYIPEDGIVNAVARLRNHPNASVYMLNVGNRDSIKDEVVAKLMNLLNK
ncbi:Cancer-related nucleoside-triphosphatase-like protein [Nymphaea thermarum]|nr:Cancer-related nucleoside-triphosphatase-like protein [Nymphaea thermarum]